MIDTDKYEGYTPSGEGHYQWVSLKPRISESPNAKEKRLSAIEGCSIEMYILDERWSEEEGRVASANQALITDAPLLLEAYKRLRDGIRGILSDYDITELIRDVPEDEWNFEQQALVRMKELIE